MGSQDDSNDEPAAVSRLTMTTVAACPTTPSRRVEVTRLLSDHHAAHHHGNKGKRMSPLTLRLVEMALATGGGARRNRLDDTAARGNAIDFNQHHEEGTYGDEEDEEAAEKRRDASSLSMISHRRLTPSSSSRQADDAAVTASSPLSPLPAAAVGSRSPSHIEGSRDNVMAPEKSATSPLSTRFACSPSPNSTSAHNAQLTNGARSQQHGDEEEPQQSHKKEEPTSSSVFIESPSDANRRRLLLMADVLTPSHPNATMTTTTLVTTPLRGQQQTSVAAAAAPSSSSSSSPPRLPAASPTTADQHTTVQRQRLQLMASIGASSTMLSYSAVPTSPSRRGGGLLLDGRAAALPSSSSPGGDATAATAAGARRVGWGRTVAHLFSGGSQGSLSTQAEDSAERSRGPVAEADIAAMKRPQGDATRLGDEASRQRSDVSFGRKDPVTGGLAIESRESRHRMEIIVAENVTRDALLVGLRGWRAAAKAKHAAAAATRSNSNGLRPSSVAAAERGGDHRDDMDPATATTTRSAAGMWHQRRESLLSSELAARVSLHEGEAAIRRSELTHVRDRMRFVVHQQMDFEALFNEEQSSRPPLSWEALWSNPNPIPIATTVATSGRSGSPMPSSSITDVIDGNDAALKGHHLADDGSHERKATGGVQKGTMLTFVGDFLAMDDLLTDELIDASALLELSHGDATTVPPSPSLHLPNPPPWSRPSAGRRGLQQEECGRTLHRDVARFIAAENSPFCFGFPPPLLTKAATSSSRISWTTHLQRRQADRGDVRHCSANEEGKEGESNDQNRRLQLSSTNPRAVEWEHLMTFSAQLQRRQFASDHHHDLSIRSGTGRKGRQGQEEEHEGGVMRQLQPADAVAEQKDQSPLSTRDKDQSVVVPVMVHSQLAAATVARGFAYVLGRCCAGEDVPPTMVPCRLVWADVKEAAAAAGVFQHAAPFASFLSDDVFSSPSDSDGGGVGDEEEDTMMLGALRQELTHLTLDGIIRRRVVEAVQRRVRLPQ